VVDARLLPVEIVERLLEIGKYAAHPLVELLEALDIGALRR
jgi:hypothetical protein